MSSVNASIGIVVVACCAARIAKSPVAVRKLLDVQSITTLIDHKVLARNMLQKSSRPKSMSLMMKPSRCNSA